MDKKYLAHKLKRLREKSGMTQYEVAIYLNLTRSAYSYYEIGKTEPSLQSIVTLAKLYNVSTDELLMPKARKLYLGK